MNPYDVLGVPKTATSDQIKKQYRKLSLEHHPDRPNGNASKFKDINEAYETLSDDQKRQQYDNPFSNIGHPQDIFEMMFKNGFPQGAHIFHQGTGFPPGFMFQHLMKPPPLCVSISISLDQAYTGCKIPVTIERWVHENNVKQSQQETCYVDIPQGMDTNESLLLVNKGNMGPDGSLGDVRITIILAPKPDQKLERRGMDLYYTHNITLKEALCGFSFELNYLLGKTYRINNARGSIIMPQYTKIIPEMGMKRDGHVGKLIIVFNIVFPSTLSETTMDKLSELL